MAEEEFRWVALTLVAITSMIFLLQTAFPAITDMFSLDAASFFSRPWTIVTYIFMHGSFEHLYSNMFALFIFGSLLERTVGWKNLLKVFFATGVLSGAASMFFYPSVIGASGAIFGVMGTLALLRPKMIVWAVGIPLPMVVVAGIYAALSVGGFLYPSDVAYAGHISALIVGVIIGIAWRKKYAPFEIKEERIELDEEYFRKWEEDYMKNRKQD